MHVIVGPPQIDQRSGSVARYIFFILISEIKRLGCLKVIESFYLRQNLTDMYSLMCVCLVYLCHSWGSASLTHSYLLFWASHCFLCQQCPANWPPLLSYPERAGAQHWHKVGLTSSTLAQLWASAWEIVFPGMLYSTIITTSVTRWDVLAPYLSDWSCRCGAPHFEVCGAFFHAIFKLTRCKMENAIIFLIVKSYFCSHVKLQLTGLHDGRLIIWKCYIQKYYFYNSIYTIKVQERTKHKHQTTLN